MFKKKVSHTQQNIMQYYFMILYSSKILWSMLIVFVFILQGNIHKSIPHFWPAPTDYEDVTPIPSFSFLFLRQSLMQFKLALNSLYTWD